MVAGGDNLDKPPPQVVTERRGDRDWSSGDRNSLLLTLVAGAIVGVNRSERGRAAGFRTTILVCLTASASMILGNLLLGTTGRPFNSFVTMDVMRLPLGILTGMGFIGAGAILHRANMVTG